MLVAPVEKFLLPKIRAWSVMLSVVNRSLMSRKTGGDDEILSIPRLAASATHTETPHSNSGLVVYHFTDGGYPQAFTSTCLDAFGAVARLRPSYLVCDGTVPRTRLPEALSAVKQVAQKYNLPIGNVFHAGDGNLHPLILFDDRNAEEMERVHQAGMEILKIQQTFY